MINNTWLHWKTTLGGIALAASTVVLNGRTPAALGLAVAMAIFGALAKDPTAKN